jgi:hypothetical protein
MGRNWKIVRARNPARRGGGEQTFLSIAGLTDGCSAPIRLSNQTFVFALTEGQRPLLAVNPSSKSSFSTFSDQSRRGDGYFRHIGPPNQTFVFSSAKVGDRSSASIPPSTSKLSTFSFRLTFGDGYLTPFGLQNKL